MLNGLTKVKLDKVQTGWLSLALDQARLDLD